MKVCDLKLEKTASRVRAAATVTWEDCGRPPQEIYFETNDVFGSWLSCNPNAFLTMCILPAMHHGEKRVIIDGEICPLLLNGLTVVMNWFQNWFEPNRELVRIEASGRQSPPQRSGARNAAIFMSGGIDSLATLRYNHLNFPPEHPWYIRDGIFIQGQNIESDNSTEAFGSALAALSGVCADAEITLLPIMTNVRVLEESTPFFVKQFQAAILSAAGHAFSSRIAIAYIAASESIGSTLKLNHVQQFQPYGSHPLIDPNYTSSDVRIHHYGAELSRLEKTRLVADWLTGLQNIKVCTRNWPGENCGRCEKCIRTMLALVALGRLDQTRAFKDDDVTESMVRNIELERQSSKNSYTVEESYLELIPALSARGRQDLVRAIEDLIARSRYREPSAFRQGIKKFDQAYMGGTISRLKRFARPRIAVNR